MKLRFLLPVIRLFGLTILTILGPFRWKHRTRVPRTGGVLLLANHVSDIDPVLVQAALSRPVHFMAKEELFSMPVLGRLIVWFGAFPVRRGEPDRAAIRRAVDLLRQGEVVCVFPEGGISESGQLQPILPGVSLIARKSECAVVCVEIQNAQHIMPYGQTVPRPAWRWVTVAFGEPWQESADFTARVRDEILLLSGARPES